MLLSNGTRRGYDPKQARLSLRFRRNEGNLFSARGPTSLPVSRTVCGVKTTRKIEAPEKEGRQRDRSVSECPRSTRVQSSCQLLPSFERGYRRADLLGVV
ncbi:hypothetical protein MRX96_058579 [Rhipicephalus microplus]